MTPWWPRLKSSLAQGSKNRLNRVAGVATVFASYYPLAIVLSDKQQNVDTRPIVMAIKMGWYIRKVFQASYKCSAITLSPHMSRRPNTRSSSLPLLCVPFRPTSFARRSFSTAGLLFWNSLPTALLNCDSLPTFQENLKTRFVRLCRKHPTDLFRQNLCSRLRHCGHIQVYYYYFLFTRGTFIHPGLDIKDSYVMY